MSFSPVDLHIAKQKMQLKNSNFCLSFLTTLWKGEVIMCCFNNVSKELSDIFCLQQMEPADVECLEKIINDFINLTN
jgi:hypothetical protein